MKKYSPVTQVVAIGVGAALFFLLARFVAIPTPIPNTSITFQYALLAVLVVLFGPVAGAVAGFVGHLLADATGYGVWISWEIATAVFALALGVFVLRNRVHEGEFSGRFAVRFSLGVIVGHLVAWLGVAPLLDILIYSEPADKVFVQGAFAFVVNAVLTIVFGLVILAAYAKSRTKTGSLEADA